MLLDKNSVAMTTINDISKNGFVNVKGDSKCLSQVQVLLFHSFLILLFLPFYRAGSWNSINGGASKGKRKQQNGYLCKI